jgi:hypothetical protein
MLYWRHSNKARILRINIIITNMSSTLTLLFKTLVIALWQNTYPMDQISLKVVGNEKEGGPERCQTLTICLWPRRSMFFSLLILQKAKAKSIGNVLTNRQNAANCCFHRGFKKSAEELRMGIPALRQYIDATIPLAPIGNGVQICSVYNFQILFHRFFFLLSRIA